MPETAEITVRNFLEQEQGVVVYLTDDAGFTRQIRSLMARMLDSNESLLVHSVAESALEECLDLTEQEVPFVLLVERMLAGNPTTDFIIRLKGELPEARVVVLTWEATRETVAYFFELGVGRVLVKPASANGILEALAAAIAPPVEFRAQMDLCRSLLDEERFHQALEASDHLLMARPDSARGLVLHGEALMGLGEVDRAVTYFMAAHEARPIYMAPLVKLAEAFRSMDDERALSYLKQLDRLSPLNPERKIDIAREHLRQGNPEQAEAYLDQSMRVAESEMNSMVGDLTERIVDAVSTVAPDLAVKYLKRVVDDRRTLGRDDLVHFNRLGILLRGEGRWSEAVEVYKKALDIAPDDPAVLYNMGLAYWEGGKRRVALDSFERALELDPQFHAGSLGATLNLGTLYLEQRQPDRARPFFEHALELAPDNDLARRKLAMVDRAAGIKPHGDSAKSDAPEAGEGNEDPHDGHREEKADAFFESLARPFRKRDKKKKKRKPFINLDL